MISRSVLIASALVVGGCVTSHTVEQTRIGDGTLDCEDVAARIGEHRAIKALAEDKKGVSGENVASFLFFWPAIFGNVANANKTIESSDRRIGTLSRIYENNSCVVDIPSYTHKEIAQMLKDGTVTDLQ